MEDRLSELPEFRDWSIAAVRLLQGVVYHDDEANWDRILKHRSTIEGYFGRIGLLLTIDEPDGYAFLRQAEQDELPREYEAVPRLSRNVPLSYGASVLCVLLREELRRFEEEEVHHERCVLTAADLFDQWKLFFPTEADEVKQRREMERNLRSLESLKFVRQISTDPDEWEIRRVLKARVSAADLENLREQYLTLSR